MLTGPPLVMDRLGAFEKLLAAYSQIAAMLPQFDRLGTALQDNPDFQQVLAIVCSDILEFHQHAYKFFMRNSKTCMIGYMYRTSDMSQAGCVSLNRHGVNSRADSIAS